ncbi:MAG: hypothetical protein BWX78_01376 [Firmicutes bacterium ADurb.Bin099]|nr:MAG: hypothetical protein BWX78_01376 [Firmicutes bacterium ADurb.Bin099]
MINKNTLYYYINKYSSIMPNNPPSTEWYNSISANINSYLKYNYGLREVLVMDYIDPDSEDDILAWIKEKINLVFVGNANKYIKLFQIDTANTSALSDKKWTKTTNYSGNDETMLSGSDSTANTGHDTRALTNGGSDTSALTTGGSDTSALTNGGSDSGSETHGGTDTTTNSKPVFDLAVDVNAGSSATQNGETINTSTKYGKTENNTTTYGKTENNTYSYGKTENDTTTYGKTTATTYGKKETLKHGKSVSESYDGTEDDMRALKDYKYFWGKWSFIDIVSRDIINEITYSSIF